MAAGCAREVDREPQSAGQAISTWRLVAQHTGQMCRPSAGQARFAFRVVQSGQLDFTPTLSLGCCNWDLDSYNRAKIRAVLRGIRFAALTDEEAGWTIRS